MDDIDKYLAANTQPFEDDLCELLRIPSISADSSRNNDTRRAADWVAGQFFWKELAALAAVPSQS